MKITRKTRAWALTRDHYIVVISLLVSLLMVIVTMHWNVGSAQGETPAQRCARETAAYNSAWAQSWAATNGRPAAEAPPPPVPYVCQNPSEPQPTTPAPSVTAPTIPMTSAAPGEGARPTLHAPTDIPAPGDGPIAGRTSSSEVPAAPATENAEPLPPLSDEILAGDAPAGWTDDLIPASTLADLTVGELSLGLQATPVGWLDWKVPDAWKIPYYAGKCALALVMLFLPLVRSPKFLLKLGEMAVKYPKLKKAIDGLRDILTKSRIEKWDEKKWREQLPKDLNKWLNKHRDSVELILELLGVAAVWVKSRVVV